MAVQVELESYADTIRYALRRERLSRHVKPAQLGRRMAALGYPWHPQTVHNVEAGRRRITAEEVLGLALSLECPMSALMGPAHTLRPLVVALPDGGRILNSAVALSTGRRAATHEDWWIRWTDEDTPIWPPPAALERLLDLEHEQQRVSREVNEAVSTGFQPDGTLVDLTAYTARLQALRAEVEQLLEGLRGGGGWGHPSAEPRELPGEGG